MTNQQHPITTPEDLLQQLGKLGSWQEIITKAYQAGADQELEACCTSLRRMVGTFSAAAHLEAQRRSDELRSARRPKPSLKEQALTALHAVATGANDTREQHQDLDTIRQALEALPND